jgi:hypothetical protein
MIEAFNLFNHLNNASSPIPAALPSTLPNLFRFPNAAAQLTIPLNTAAAFIGRHHQRICTTPSASCGAPLFLTTCADSSAVLSKFAPFFAKVAIFS